MMNDIHTTLPGQVLGAVEQYRVLFSRRFNAPFSIWMQTDDGFHLVGPSHDATDANVERHLARWHAGFTAPIAEQYFEPTVVSHPVETLEDCDAVSELVIQVVPQHASMCLLVAGLTQQSRSELVSQLAASTMQQADSQAELQDARGCLAEYADQVTNDFEELAWLRGLAEHIEVCDVKSDFVSVSNSVLPTLRELINAESLALIRRTAHGHSPQDYECAFTVGSSPIDMATWVELIETCEVKPGRPVVRNASRFHELTAETFGLRNFIIVRICRSGVDFGWLVAANRAVLGSDADGLRVNASCLSGWEFGTFEVGAVNAAAIMLGTHARNSQLFREREELLLGVVRALINAVDAKDAYTCGHSDRVASIAQRIARKMNLGATECERIYMAGLLHDIGKIGIPDDVLCKTGKLTEEEYGVIKQHPEIGYSILKHVKQLEYVLPGVLHHHEAYDGTGYPHGLAGEEIPVYGRVLAVADSYDAMTSTRSYRKAMDTEKAKQILRDGSGAQWDPEAVKGFFAALPEIEEICQENHAGGWVQDSAELYEKRVSEPWDALSAALTALENVYD